MLNVTRSLFYVARRDLVILVTLITCCLWTPLLSVLFSGSSFSEATGSSYTIGLSDGTIIAVFALLVLVARAAGSDLSDRTVNYEILIGHPRWKSFAARLVLSLLLGGLGTWLVLYLPVGVFTLLHGWGAAGDAGNMLLRMVLSVFPLLRFSAFTFLMTMLLNGFGKGLVVSFIAFDVVSALVSTVEELFGMKLHSWLAYSDLSDLVVYDNAKSIIQDGQTMMRYETALPASHVYSTILLSLLFIGLYAVIGYVIFQRKDRH